MFSAAGCRELLMLSSLHTAAEKILGELKKKQNKPWISHETLSHEIYHRRPVRVFPTLLSKSMGLEHLLTYSRR